MRAAGQQPIEEVIRREKEKLHRSVEGNFGIRQGAIETQKIVYKRYREIDGKNFRNSVQNNQYNLRNQQLNEENGSNSTTIREAQSAHRKQRHEQYGIESKDQRKEITEHNRKKEV